MVDERRNETELGAAEPESDVLEPVLHEEGHAVAVLEAGAEEHVRHAVRVGLLESIFETSVLAEIFMDI
jgi:hypothetical protein